MARHLIGSISQIPSGEGRTFVVDGVPIAIFHTRDGQVYATQAHCPHRGGPLADGLTDGTTIVCPLHDRMFSLTTGEGIGNDCALSIYPVDLDGAQVFAIISEKAVLF